MSIKKLIVTTAALTATLGTGLAQANQGADVQWSVTIGAPGVVPAYSAPYPVYRQPAPVYRTYPSYPSYQHPSRWDRDGDGIPNRYDRWNNLRHDRDGDGIPNRRDYHDNRSWGR